MKNLLNPEMVLAIIAIVALISPVLVAIVNDIATYKLKSAEIKAQQKVAKQKQSLEYRSKVNKLVSDFISAANELNTYEQTGNVPVKAKARTKFAQSCSNLLAYVPRKEQSKLLDWLDYSLVDDKAGWLKITMQINLHASDLLALVNKVAKDDSDNR